MFRGIYKNSVKHVAAGLFLALFLFPALAKPSNSAMSIPSPPRLKVCKCMTKMCECNCCKLCSGQSRQSCHCSFKANTPFPASPLPFNSQNNVTKILTDLTFIRSVPGHFAAAHFKPNAADAPALDQPDPPPRTLRLSPPILQSLAPAQSH